jgi:hypothetical protein
MGKRGRPRKNPQIEPDNTGPIQNQNQTLQQEEIKEVPKEDTKIKELEDRINLLASATEKSLQSVIQDYSTKIKEVNDNVGSLKQAIDLLNEEFTKFIETWYNKQTGGNLPASNPANPEVPLPQNPALNNPVETIPIASQRIDLSKPEVKEPSTQDKLLAWANILTQFLQASGGASSSGGDNITRMLELIMQIQDRAEQRALERQEVVIKNVATLANLFTKGKIAVLEEKPAEAVASPHISETK